ncbi:MAG: sugar (Glycoside-Pentoside-Hexuronide) transporter [Massilia sp.]|jgi:GPH family glycoside/pentoside/hexuronide:cation symporter|nr:sugar (Glycoside-Pentoside-Hexuronide) transporter [Massilia sp.]
MSSMSAIPAREKFAYGMGDFASMLIFQTVGTFLMFFYTDIGGLPAAAVGTLLLVARVSDAVWDIFLGTMIDRTSTRWGQCRPYILFGAPLVAVCAVATFSVPAGDTAARLVYAYVTYILLMMAYSVVNIPYGAMPALMTDDPRDRTKLASVRMFCALTCALLVNTSTVKLVEWFGAGSKQAGYQNTIIVMSILGMLLFWFCFAGTRERVKPVQQPIELRRDLSTLVAGRAWWMIALIGTCVYTSFAITSGSAMYYFTYVVGDASKAAAYFLCIGLGNLSGILLSYQLTRRICKRYVMMGASLCAATLYGVFYLIDPHSAVQVNTLGFLLYVFGGASLPIMMSMVADTADEAELRSGRRMVGLTASTVAFAVKFGLGLGGALTGLILAAVGYHANVAQTPQAIEGLKLIMSAVPAVGKLLVFVILLFYPLSQKRLDIMQPLLRQARAA